MNERPDKVAGHLIDDPIDNEEEINWERAFSPSPKSSKTPITHESLRKRAVQWLTKTKHCSVVLSEMVTGAWEIPDAIGWYLGTSIVVECKVSRSDFHANKNKPTIRAGMGNQRFFMVPAGLLNESDVEGTDYGLLSVTESGMVRVLRDAPRRDGNQTSEIKMLVSALRRIKQREFIILVPEIEEAEKGSS